MKFALAKSSLKPVQQDEENANIEQEFPFKRKTSQLSPTAASQHRLHQLSTATQWRLLIDFCKKRIKINICDIKRDLKHKRMQKCMVI